MKAQLVARDLPKYRGMANLYKVDPPVEYGDSDAPKTAEFIVVSAAIVMGYPETYIFPADENGGVLDWEELRGSQKGTLSHHAVLQDAGYEVVSTGIEVLPWPTCGL